MVEGASAGREEEPESLPEGSGEGPVEREAGGEGQLQGRGEPRRGRGQMPEIPLRRYLGLWVVEV